METDRERDDEMARKADEMMERDREFVENTEPPLQGNEDTATRAPRPRVQPRGANLWDRVRAWITGR